MTDRLAVGDIYEHCPIDLPGEFVEQIGGRGSVRIERIVSRGHSSPPGFWYDQDQEEWVLLLKGAAAIRFDARDQVIELREGAYLSIPAHTRHRVEWTQSDTETVWLAIHLG